MTGTCDRCHRNGKTFRIPWTGDHLCKDCIDQDSGLQQMFAEIDSMVERHLWTPTECKTPEQTLYGSIFREINAKEHPRIVKSDVKGKFRVAD